MRIKKIHDRHARKRRIRARIYGTKDRPRLSVHRTLRNIFAQLIDDDAGCTVLAASTREVKVKLSIDGAKKVGELIAAKAKKAKIGSIVFDRNAYKYHGRVKALADAARAGGLNF